MSDGPDPLQTDDGSATDAPGRPFLLVTGALACLSLLVLGVVGLVVLFLWRNSIIHSAHTAEIEINRDHEWDTFKTEVDNQLLSVRSQLTSADARLRDRDAEGAVADLEEAERILDDLQLIAEDFTTWNALERNQQHLDDRSPEAVRLRQEIALRLGRAHGRRRGAGALAAARSALEAGIDEAPKSTEASALRLELACVQAQSGDHDGAFAMFEEILQAAPRDVAARRSYAQALFDAERYAQAEAQLTRALADAPEPGEVLLLRGAARFQERRFEAALQDFDQVLESRDDSYYGYLWRGRTHQALGNYERAYVDLSEAIDITPSLPDGYHARGQLQLTRRMLPQAIKDAEVAISRHSEFWPAHMLLAKALVWSFQEERAEELSLSLIGGQAPPRVQAKAHLALVRLLSGQTGTHLAQLEAAAKVRAETGRDPRTDEVDAGMERLAAARWGGADEHLQAALRLAPGDMAVLLEGARLSLLRGDAQTAAQLLEKIDPQRLGPQRITFLLLRAEQQLLGGKTAEAAALFQEASRLDPRSAAAQAGLARVARARGADSEEFFARARALRFEDPGEIGFFFSEGLRFADLAKRGGNPEDRARESRAYARVLALDPHHTPALLAWASSCIQQRETDVAMGLLIRARDSDPTFPSSSLALGQLLLRLPAQRDPATQRPRTLRDPQAAEAALTEALKLGAQGAERARALHRRGEARRALAGSEASKLGAAADDLQQALDAYPPSSPEAAPCAETLAEVLRELGHGGAADEASHRAVALSAERAEMARQEFSRGRAARDQLRYAEAIQDFDRAIALDPTLSAAYYDRGTCYLKIGRFVPGILDFSRALELDPRVADQVYSKVYQISYVVDLNRVITEMTKIVSERPRASYAVFMRGFFYVAKAEVKDAPETDLRAGIADFDRTLELNPRHVSAYLYRGLLRIKQALHARTQAERDQRYAEALADFARARELDPPSALAHYQEALLWAQRSAEEIPPAEVEARQARALESLRRSFELEFKGYERIRNEKAFEGLRGLPAFQELMRGR